MNFAEQRLFRSNGEWNRQRIKHHVKGFFGGGTPSTENREFWTNGTIPWVSSKDMKVARLRETQDYITPAAVIGSATNLVRPGSVLMVVRSGILKHSIPVAINDVEVALNQDLKAFVLRKTLDPEFFLYWVTGQQRDLLLEWGQLGATVDSLNIEILRNTVIPLPSLEGQRTIVSFLDSETGRIDGLIEKKTRFIALLKEKRAAVITHAVTKGIDADVELRPTRSPFLKEIPEGWSFTPIKFITSKIGSGKTPSGGAENYLPEGVMFLRSQNVYDDGLRLDDIVRISDTIHQEMHVSRIKPQDVLLNITGASIGRSSIVPNEFPEANVNQHVCIIRAQDIKNSEWLHAVMTSHLVKEQISAMQTGAGREGLNFEQVGNISVTLPDVRTQEKILVSIRSQTAKLDSLISTTNRSIDLLREKRAALITAAVTGKIDVRAAA